MVKMQMILYLLKLLIATRDFIINWILQIEHNLLHKLILHVLKIASVDNSV